MKEVRSISSHIVHYVSQRFFHHQRSSVWPQAHPRVHGTSASAHAWPRLSSVNQYYPDLERARPSPGRVSASACNAGWRKHPKEHAWSDLTRLDRYQHCLTASQLWFPLLNVRDKSTVNDSKWWKRYRRNKRLSEWQRSDEYDKTSDDRYRTAFLRDR